MKIFYFKAGSKEWLDCRKKYITGTAVASLLGMNNYQNIKEFIDIKFNGKVVNIPDNPAMRTGRILEPGHFIALGELGFPAEDAAPANTVKCVVHDNNKLMATLDGILYDENGGMPVECKSPGENVWKSIHQPAKKRGYFIQLYTQILCHSLNSGLLSIMEAKGKNNILVYKLERSEELDKIILDSVERFYKEKEQFTVCKKDKERVINLMQDQITLLKQTDL